MYVAVGVLLDVSEDVTLGVFVGLDDGVLVGVLVEVSEVVTRGVFVGVVEDVLLGVLLEVSEVVTLGVLVGVGLAEAVLLFEATPLSICCEIATDCATDARELIAPAA